MDQGSRSGAGLSFKLQWGVDSSLGNHVKGGGMHDTTDGGRQDRVDAPPDTVVFGSRSTCVSGSPGCSRNIGTTTDIVFYGFIGTLMIQRTTQIQNSHN